MMLDLLLFLVGSVVGVVGVLLLQDYYCKMRSRRVFGQDFQEDEALIDVIETFKASDDNPEQEDVDVMELRKRNRNFYS